MPESVTPTQERLLELLDIRDRELDAANHRAGLLERQLQDGVDWMLQRHTRQDEFELPTPRLQLRLLSDDGYTSQWALDLVHKDRGGTVGRVPLGCSKRSGGGGERSLPPTLDSAEDQRLLNNYLPTLVHDLCYAHETMGLPAYVLAQGRVVQVERLHPLHFKYTS